MMTNVEETPEANAIATIVADRCHGDRKPNQARERYAIIWQAARLGALEAMKQPAMDGIPDPAAFVQAARGMAEALEIARTELEGYAEEFMGENYNCPSLNEALSAFRAATVGEA